jgi:hypothetical protein
MTIDVNRKDGGIYIRDAKNYDFYPETKILFVECENNKVFFIPINEKVQCVSINGGIERDI